MSLLLVFCLLGWDGPGAKEWAEGLASPSADRRHATIDAIEVQDLKALPILREIAATASVEVRQRASALIDRITTKRLLRPTLVKLDFTDRPLNEAIKEISESSGFSIELEPNFPNPERKISVKAGGSIGLFESLDRLGAAGEFRIDLNSALGSDRKPGVRLRLASSKLPPPPTWYVGPYRVTLRSLDRHRQVIQARPPLASKVQEEFFAAMDVIAEPGILMERNGSARVQEARDEEGHDLKPAVANDTSTTSNSGRQWSIEEVGRFSYRLPLHLPESRGKKIVKLRGFIPITAVTRTDELFSASTVDIQGKTLQHHGVGLRVNRAAITGNTGFYEITLQGESLIDPLSQLYAPGPRQTTLATLPQAFGPDDHIRIEDANGRAFGTQTNGVPSQAVDGSRNYRVTLYNNLTTGPPAKLRYFGVAGVATEVSFEFRDLELP